MSDNELRSKNADLTEQLTAAQADSKRLRGLYGGLKLDQEDWRKGVALIASALGEKNPPDLCCSRLADAIFYYRQRLEVADGVLERDGYRRCDIPACNCGSWHRPMSEKDHCPACCGSPDGWLDGPKCTGLLSPEKDSVVAAARSYRDHFLVMGKTPPMSWRARRGALARDLCFAVEALDEKESIKSRESR